MLDPHAPQSLPHPPLLSSSSQSLLFYLVTCPSPAVSLLHLLPPLNVPGATRGALPAPAALCLPARPGRLGTSPGGVGTPQLAAPCTPRLPLLMPTGPENRNHQAEPLYFWPIPPSSPHLSLPPFHCVKVPFLQFIPAPEPATQQLQPPGGLRGPSHLCPCPLCVPAVPWEAGSPRHPGFPLQQTLLAFPNCRAWSTDPFTSLVENVL